MLGIKFLKVPPTTYVLHYHRGKLKREGAGMSFYYFAPYAMIVNVPQASTDVPFVFNEVTADFQDATIQGELTYRITDPKRVAQVLDFSVDAQGRYRSDDPTRLNDRLVHDVQTLARAFTQRHRLGQLLTSSEALVGEVLAHLRHSPSASTLGIEVLGLSIQSIQATPEMAKALQADAREGLLRQADEAIYARRNSAVEQERIIRENELNTEIAVEQKQRQVRETQMEAELAVEQKKRLVREAQMAADVSVEHQRAEWVDQRVANEHKEAESRAYALQTVLEPIRSIDWRTLLAANSAGDSRLMVGMAFQELAQNAAKIGELNMSPDLLQALLKSRQE